MRQFSKSRVSCLFRHRGGNYYAVAKVGGKVIRRSLETDDFNTASNLLPAALVQMRGAKHSTAADTLGAAIRAEAAREDPTLVPDTWEYYRQIAAALAKIGAGMAAGTLKTSDKGKKVEDPLVKSIAKVKLSDLRNLMDAYAATTAATRYNGALALLRRVYDTAVEEGHVAKNIPDELKRMKPATLSMDLPTSEEFASVVANILAQQKAHSKAAAMCVEWLAYTGMRISEAQRVRWRDIKSDNFVVRSAKNKIMRQVPLIEGAKDLLARMRAAGLPTGPKVKVMLLTSPRMALDGACRRLEFDHLRIHDLRHIFATRCIEAGVPLPTLAGWLGHKDNGVLCAQVYGHLCDKHSAEMAAKVVV